MQQLKCSEQLPAIQADALQGQAHVPPELVQCLPQVGVKALVDEAQVAVVLERLMESDYVSLISRVCLVQSEHDLPLLLA